MNKCIEFKGRYFEIYMYICYRFLVFQNFQTDFIVRFSICFKDNANKI